MHKFDRAKTKSSNNSVTMHPNDELTSCMIDESKHCLKRRGASLLGSIVYLIFEPINLTMYNRS